MIALTQLAQHFDSEEFKEDAAASFGRICSTALAPFSYASPLVSGVKVLASFDE